MTLVMTSVWKHFSLHSENQTVCVAVLPSIWAALNSIWQSKKENTELRSAHTEGGRSSLHEANDSVKTTSCWKTPPLNFVFYNLNGNNKKNYHLLIFYENDWFRQTLMLSGSKSGSLAASGSGEILTASFFCSVFLGGMMDGQMDSKRGDSDHRGWVKEAEELPQWDV